jgi:hypothetical protein
VQFAYADIRDRLDFSCPCIADSEHRKVAAIALLCTMMVCISISATSTATAAAAMDYQCKNSD